MKKVTRLAGLNYTNKKFTNHSVQKTTVHKLQKAGILNDNIAAITGHHNEQSLRDYATTDLEDHKAMHRHCTVSQQVVTNSQSKIPPLWCHAPLLELQNHSIISYIAMYTLEAILHVPR